MKMRQEFNNIRRYNFHIVKFITKSNVCNRKIKANLRDLEYYRTAKPIEGLDDFHQIIIKQVIINKMVELYEENVGLRVKVDSLSTAVKKFHRLNELHIVHY